MAHLKDKLLMQPDTLWIIKLVQDLNIYNVIKSPDLSLDMFMDDWSEKNRKYCIKTEDKPN